MKKGLIAVVLVAVLAAGGAGGYTVYQKKVAEKKYEQDMTKTISSLPAITVYIQASRVNMMLNTLLKTAMAQTGLQL